MNTSIQWISAILLLAININPMCCNHGSADDDCMPNSGELEFKIVVTQTVGAAGADIVIENTGTPVDGIRLEIPPDALETDDTFEIGYLEGDVEVNTGRPSGIIVSFSAESIMEFAEPVLIHIPLDTSIGANLIVPYAIEEDGELNLLDLLEINSERSEAVFTTTRPLVFTWIYP